MTVSSLITGQMTGFLNSRGGLSPSPNSLSFPSVCGPQNGNSTNTITEISCLPWLVQLIVVLLLL